MKKYFTLSMMFLVLTMQVKAGEAWITDRLEIPVKERPELTANSIAWLPAGMAVETLESSKDGDYVKIRFQNQSGWVSKQNLLEQPSLQVRSQQMQDELNSLQQRYNELRQNSGHFAELVEGLQKENQKLKEKESSARQELVHLKRASQNVVAIDQRNKVLQERMVNLEQENQKISNENVRLRDSADERKMLIGGGLMFAGFALQWLWMLFNRSRISRRSSFINL